MVGSLLPHSACNDNKSNSSRVTLDDNIFMNSEPHKLAIIMHGYQQYRMYRSVYLLLHYRKLLCLL